MTNDELKSLTPLTTGAYAIAPNCKAFVRGGMVIVSEKRRPIAPDNTPRCRDCKHFGKGQIQYNGAWRDVCLNRPKFNGRHNAYPKHVIKQQRYFAAYPGDKACDQYEPITPNNNEQQSI